MSDAAPQPRHVPRGQKAEGPLEPLFLARSINLLAGSSGAGKTALMAMLARQFLRRQPVLGYAPTTEAPPYLAYIGTDKSWVESSSRWFELEGVRLKHYCLIDDRTFQKRRLRTKNDRTAIFHEFLNKVTPDGRTFPPGALVFVESIAIFLGGNLLDYDSTAVACMEIRQLLQEMGNAAVIGSVHGGKIKADKKQGYARLQDHILGSAALYGYSDTQMYLASPEELRSRHHVLQVTPHHAPPFRLDLSRDKQGRFLSEGQPGTPEHHGWVLECFTGAADATLDLATLVKEAVTRECSRSTLKRILESHIEAGRLVKVRHGVYKLLKPS